MKNAGTCNALGYNGETGSKVRHPVPYMSILTTRRSAFISSAFSRMFVLLSQISQTFIPQNDRNILLIPLFITVLCCHPVGKFFKTNFNPITETFFSTKLPLFQKGKYNKIIKLLFRINIFWVRYLIAFITKKTENQ